MNTARMRTSGFISMLTGMLLLSSCGKKSEVTLETATVEKGEITETVTATGTVESVTTVDVGTQVTGIISKLYVDFNSEVKAGDLLAEIDKTVLESNLRSANANMESMKRTYEYNRTNYERDRKLHEKQLISDYEFETSEKDYQVSKANYEKAQADRVASQRNLSYAEIYAPIDGTIISRDVEIGQTVVSSMTVANLFTIADLENMRVVANVDEADIGEVKTGQRVTFTVDAFPNDSFNGTVTQVRLSPTTESNVVTYEVIVSADNKDHKLIPGLTANITIYTVELDNVLTIPVKALRFRPMDETEAKSAPTAPGDHTVYTVGNDNSLTPISVKTGTDNGIVVQIISGLKDGQKVALQYNENANDDKTPQTGEKSPFAPGPPDNKNKNAKK